MGKCYTHTKPWQKVDKADCHYCRLAKLEAEIMDIVTDSTEAYKARIAELEVENQRLKEAAKAACDIYFVERGEGMLEEMQRLAALLEDE